MRESRFPAECRRFLQTLDAAASAADSNPAHAAACASCAARLRAARANAAALRAMPAPPVPAELASAEFLAGIYQRASEDAESRLGTVLGAGLTPVEAPADVIWQRSEDRPEIAASLRSLPPVRTPGWLWSRIRGDVAPTEVPARWTGGLRVAAGLVAAALLVSAALIIHNADGATQNDGTASPTTIVWNDSSGALEPSLSLDSFFEAGG